MNRFTAVIAIATLLGVSLVACASDDETARNAPETVVESTQSTAATLPSSSATTTPPPVTPASIESAGPVTIEHLYGDTVIDGLPDRIVSLDMQWTDVLTALGHPPVAAIVDPASDG